MRKSTLGFFVNILLNVYILLSPISLSTLGCQGYQVLLSGIPQLYTLPGIPKLPWESRTMNRSLPCICCTSPHELSISLCTGHTISILATIMSLYCHYCVVTVDVPRCQDPFSHCQDQSLDVHSWWTLFCVLVCWDIQLVHIKHRPYY